MIEWIKPTEIINLVMNCTFENTISPSDTIKKHNEAEKSAISHVLKFPTASIENIVLLIESLTEMESAISTILNFTDENVTYFELIFPRFTSLASDALSNKNHPVCDIDPEKSITNTFKKLLTTYVIKPSLGNVFSSLFNSIKALPVNCQSVLSKLLTHQILLVFFLSRKIFHSFYSFYSKLVDSGSIN